MDFATFVFAPDDWADVRGEHYIVVRDNVLYELGLFTAHLHPERCFFVLPDTISVHIPSDLAGVTHGYYEARRSDRNTTAAVGTFCSQVKERIRELSFFERPLPAVLHELVVKFECSDWIDNMPARVREKNSIVSEMVALLRRDPLDKRALLNRDRIGLKVLLAAAIQAAPSKGDGELILSIKPRTVGRGVAQRTMVDTIELLESKQLVASPQRKVFADWLGDLQDVDPSLVDSIAELRARLI
jgi:hypothetical protein